MGRGRRASAFLRKQWNAEQEIVVVREVQEAPRRLRLCRRQMA